MVVFDTEKHSNVKRRAEYRRIKKNYKTLEKFKQEKLRRGQILELQDQGLHLKEIAERLGVSESTIKRGLFMGSLRMLEREVFHLIPLCMSESVLIRTFSKKFVTA